MNDTTAIVLAGGRNEGFGVLTRDRAKAALVYAGHYRLIDFALSSLSDAGITRVGLVIQFLPGSLLDHVGAGRAWDFDGLQRRLKVMPPFVGVGDTRWYEGTADALRRNMRFIHPDRGSDVLICSGEHAYAIDFQDVVRSHRERGADLTIVAKNIEPRDDSDRLGRVAFDPETGRVERFVEKPRERFTPWASIGVYVFRSDVLKAALEGDGGRRPDNLPKDIVEPVSLQGRSYVYKFDGPWEYLENLGVYYESHRRLLAGGLSHPTAVWETRTNLLDRGLSARAPAHFAATSEVAGSIVSPGCRIHGRVVDSVLSPGVYVGPGAEVRESILLHDGRIEAGAVVHRTVADKDAVIGPGCRLGLSERSGKANPQLPSEAQNLTVIGKGARIGAGLELPLGSQVWPETALDAGDPELAAGECNMGSEALTDSAAP